MLRYADLSEMKGYETDDALSGCTRKTPWPAEPFSTLTLPISPVTATTMGDPELSFHSPVAYRERFHFCYA